MEDMEVLEQTEEPTQEQTEAQTEEQIQETTQEQTEQEPEQETTTETASSRSDFPLTPDNAIHEMYAALGVNLDYVPQTKGEMLLLSAQVICSLFFLWLVIRTIAQFVREFGKGV